MLPKPTRQKASDEDIQRLFEEVDTDASGTVSMDEYFFWVLGSTVGKPGSGSGIEGLFRKYDSGGEGTLDASEFNRACEDMGFTEVSHELFLEVATHRAHTTHISTALSIVPSVTPHHLHVAYTCHVPPSSTRTCRERSPMPNCTR